ncbi:hypothetical protein ACWDAZ_37950, partial [Streptomyces sp. NPDC001215]
VDGDLRAGDDGGGGDLQDSGVTGVRGRGGEDSYSAYFGAAARTLYQAATTGAPPAGPTS